MATSYIDYLMTLLNSDNPDAFLEGFKADIHKKWNEKSEEQKRRELVSPVSAFQSVNVFFTVEMESLLLLL